MKENQHTKERFTYLEPSVELYECSITSVLCASAGGNGTINDFGSDNFGEL